jgi:hypothetical protein
MSLVEWELRERRRVRPSGAEMEGAALVRREGGGSVGPRGAEGIGKG